MIPIKISQEYRNVCEYRNLLLLNIFKVSVTIMRMSLEIQKARDYFT